MKTHLKRLAVIPAAACLLASLPVGAFAAASSTITVEVDGKFEQSIARTQLEMMNEFRTSATDAWYYNSDGSKNYVTGLKEYRYNYALEKLAMQRAMETVVIWAHQRPNSTMPDATYKEFGYKYGTVAENIARMPKIGKDGKPDARETFEYLQETEENYNGQGHRRNMLKEDATDFGVACVEYNGYYYWVEEFATPIGSWAGDTEDTANDSEAAYDVETEKTRVSDYTISTETVNYSLEIDDTANLPDDLALSASIVNTGFKKNPPTNEFKVKNPTFTYAADSNIITIDGDTITANEAGTANITVSAEVDGETLATKEIPVTVTEKEAPAPTVTGISYTADGNLIANVYVDIDEELVEKGVTANIEGPTGLSVPISKEDYVDGKGYKFSIPLDAPEINDEITFTLSDAAENAIEFIVDGKKVTEYTFTAKDYANKAADKQSDKYDPKLENLANTIINYGNAAKNYFVEGSDEPVTVKEHKAEDFANYQPIETGTAPEGVKIEGTSLVLDSTTTLKLYFTAPEGFDTKTVSVDGVTREAVAVAPSILEGKENLYYVLIKNIAPANLGKTYTIKFGDSYSLDISCLTYAYKLFDKYGEDPEYQSLCTAVNALVDYYEAAKAYFPDKSE